MARSGANLAEGMQLCRPRRSEESVPRVGPKPHDAGKPAFQVAKFHRAHQRGKVSAERAQDGAILRARIERRDQENRGASKRRVYRLRDGRHLPAASGALIGSVSIGCRPSMKRVGFRPGNITRLRAQKFASKLTIACKPATASPLMGVRDGASSPDHEKR